MKIYSQIISAIISNIHKYGDVDPYLKLPVIRSESVDTKPKRPFYSYKIYEDYQRQTFNDYDHEFWSLTIQMKGHADDSLDASDMAFSLRKILWSQQFLYDLAQKGISIGNINSLPPLAIDLTTRMEYTAGVDFEVYVNDDYQDLTQPGDIQDIGFTVNNNNGGNINE